MFQCKNDFAFVIKEKYIFCFKEKIKKIRVTSKEQRFVSLLCRKIKKHSYIVL